MRPAELKLKKENLKRIKKKTQFVITMFCHQHLDLQV